MAEAGVPLREPAQDGMAEVRVELEAVRPGAKLLLPTGIPTPHEEVRAVAVEGGRIARQVAAEDLGLGALLVEPEAERVALVYTVGPSRAAVYPEAAFRPRRTPYTDAAAELAVAARDTAARAGGGGRAIQALAAEAQARFAYAHPEVRFNDGASEVPYLSCGTTPGSCIDINTYFVASLRAAGFEAAYLAGYFFPEERGGLTNDMHCWVVTRHAGEVRAWDIAHHMKAGLGEVRPGLNPRPGRRVALGHSMGHRYLLPDGPLELKLLSEPVWVQDGAALPAQPLTVRLVA